MGMMFMAGAMDLVTLYIGLETMAIATYILVGFLRSNQRSNEASLKYFLLGAFSSGILLYGMSLLYGIAGSTQFVDIAEALARRPADRSDIHDGDDHAGGGYVLQDCGRAIPSVDTRCLRRRSDFDYGFHVRCRKSSVIRHDGPGFHGCDPALRPHWVQIMAAVSVMTMTVGNIAAITQSNMKRMLAYSSISHAGYILIGFIAGTDTGLTAVVCIC